MKYLHVVDGVVRGVFGAPQPDAVDEKGNVIAKGVPTVEVEDDDPRIEAYRAAGTTASEKAALRAEMDAEDIKIIRALLEGDTVRIEAHKAAQAARRAKLLK